MRNLISVAVFTFAALGPVAGEEVSLSEPIAKATEVSLGDLLPRAIVDQASGPFAIEASGLRNDRAHPFEVSFEVILPRYPAVTMSLLVSERENVVQLVDRVLERDQGPEPFDREFPDGFTCAALESQALVSCRFGTAGLQFAAYDFQGGASISYPEAKEIFLTLPSEIYFKVFTR